MRNVDLGLLITGIPALLAIIFYPVSNESSALVPTIINGVATSTSVIVAFTGLLMTFAISNKLLELEQVRNRSYFTIVLLGLSVLFLCIAYLNEMMSLDTGSFVNSLKASIIGLFISAMTFVSFMDVTIIQLFPKGKKTKTEANS
jgi:hypothetical protein